MGGLRTLAGALSWAEPGVRRAPTAALGRGQRTGRTWCPRATQLPGRVRGQHRVPPAPGPAGPRPCPWSSTGRCRGASRASSRTGRPGCASPVPRRPAAAAPSCGPSGGAQGMWASCSAVRRPGAALLEPRPRAHSTGSAHRPSRRPPCLHVVAVPATSVNEDPGGRRPASYPHPLHPSALGGIGRGPAQSGEQVLHLAGPAPRDLPCPQALLPSSALFLWNGLSLVTLPACLLFPRPVSPGSTLRAPISSVSQ